MQAVERWGRFEYAAQGTSEGNPFAEVAFSAQFTYKHRTVVANGFYDGEGRYVVRFSPDEEGEWTFKTASSRTELDGLTGEFRCVPQSGGNHGPVVVHETYNFSYADGTPYRQVGTTAYVWNHQNAELQQETLKTLAASPFNKLRMLIFPKNYMYNFHEPAHYVYEGNPQDGWQFEKFNPVFFQEMDRQVQSLLDLGIEADLILFHSYDRWGFAQMDDDSHVFFLRYVIARYSSFRNVWWSMANEYDLMYNKSMAFWDRVLRVTQEEDPHQRLRSIHNAYGFYDHGKPWVTHCSIQHSEIHRVGEWRDLYRKPVILDETCYEGNIHPHWGNITGQEMTRRFWDATLRGGHVGHGETYLDETEVLWWSHGGKLVGSSIERIAFFKDILEDAPHEGLKPGFVNTGSPLLKKDNEYYLVYLGDRQPVYDELEFLAEGHQYKVEVIDAWNMTITPVEGLHIRNRNIKLPGTQYTAIRATIATGVQ